MLRVPLDLTCKVWDLSVGSESLCLADHPNYVTKVRYCPINKLVYTVSNSFVQIWDIRSGPKCVKVLRLVVHLNQLVVDCSNHLPHQ